jgi:hypothetical protein
MKGIRSKIYAEKNKDVRDDIINTVEETDIYY